MELSTATARALEAEALNFGAENGIVIFLYEHADHPFWSVAYKACAAPYASSFWFVSWAIVRM